MDDALDYDRWYKALDDAWKAKIRRQRRVRRGVLLAIVGIVAFAIGFAIANANPPDTPPIAISGRCTWGTVTQAGRGVAIAGGDQWSASGSIRADGRVLLFWRTSDGRTALGLYDWNPLTEMLVGHWGWHDACYLEDDDLCGDISSESFTITRDAKK